MNLKIGIFTDFDSEMVKKIGQILIKQEQNVIFIKGPNFFPRWQHILANIAGLSWKELATLMSSFS